MRTRTLGLTVGLVALGASSAWAYIPHLDFLLGRMAHKRAAAGVSRLSVELRCGSNEDALSDERLLLKAPKLVRRERAGGVVDLCRDGICTRYRDGQAIKLPAGAYFQYLFFVESNPSRDRYKRLLKALKIDTKVDTMTRAGQHVAIVLGAKEWERDRPQLWIDKDRYVPVRLFFQQGERLVDMSWLGWGSSVTGDWFPAKMVLRIDGKLVEVCHATEVDARSPLDATQFEAP